MRETDRQTDRQTDREAEAQRERDRESVSKHVLVSQKLLIQISAHEGFVMACPDWVPTTPCCSVVVVIIRSIYIYSSTTGED